MQTNRCSRRSYLNLPCNRTMMTLCFSMEDKQMHWHHTWKALKL